ncbi:MAG: Zn-ribbon domain-containing OB-fold protein [Lautropia sp.]
MSQASTYIRQLPELTDDNRTFWTAGEFGELRISRCPDCGQYTHPPSPICPGCLGRSVVPSRVSGRGRVVAYTVNRHAFVPGMPVPFIVVLVEIAEQEGTWIFSEMRHCAPERIRIGLPVRVGFEHIEDVWLPCFEPEDAI